MACNKFKVQREKYKLAGAPGLRWGGLLQDRAGIWRTWRATSLRCNGKSTNLRDKKRTFSPTRHRQMEQEETNEVCSPCGGNMKLGAYQFARRFALRLAIVCMMTAILAGWASAQQAAPAAGEPKTVPTPGIPSTGFAGLDQYRASRIAMFADDYGQLARYRAANADLQKSGTVKDGVVFFGDSITDTWQLEKYFPGKPYVNRGISGQTTPQMLVR